jgi:Lecithin:cholesterol acyltransferase
MGRHRMGDVIVLLPGILGSVLQRDGEDVWGPTPDAALRALWRLGRSLRDLRLGSHPPDRDDLGDGVVATRLVPDVHVIPGLWGIAGYSAISAMIVGTFDVVPGHTFLPIPYDWRRDNRVAAWRLAATALPALYEQRKDNPDAKLILIGHSMGGLVARLPWQGCSVPTGPPSLARRPPRQRCGPRSADGPSFTSPPTATSRRRRRLRRRPCWLRARNWPYMSWLGSGWTPPWSCSRRAGPRSAKRPQAMTSWAYPGGCWPPGPAGPW